MNKKTLVIVGVVVVVLLIAGLISRMTQKSATERAIEAVTGNNADVNVDGDDVTVKTDQGTWSTGDKLPSNWPSDVPVYPKAKVAASVSGAGNQQGGMYAALETTDSVADVIAWYKKEVPGAGWTIETDATVSGSFMLAASKGDRVLSVTVGADDGKVSIGLVVADK